MDPDTVSQTPMADPGETARETSASAPATNGDQKVSEVSGGDLPPRTIQACYRPGPKTQNRPRQTPLRRNQYVICTRASLAPRTHRDTQDAVILPRASRL